MNQPWPCAIDIFDCMPFVITEEFTQSFLLITTRLLWCLFFFSGDNAAESNRRRAPT